ncbi:hypothetical protein WKI68_09880 [Streptomyces sp. MS1.HAVA.3]|uniref:Uncharacterized protein n=1 Tax=Streptomyces caledonius TaxID=3134107 RepID=A0ABU8U1H3_9ACTN
MCGYPASFDWTFLYWYLISFGGDSPFGHSGCLDMKTLYATKARVPLRAAVKGRMPRELLSRRRHTHHALDDAIEQADLMSNLMLWQPPQPPVPDPAAEHSPRITHLSRGRIEAEGLAPGKDFRLYPGGGRPWDWSEHGTRHEPGIQPQEVREFLDLGVTAVVLGQGMEGRLGIVAQTLEVLRAAGSRCTWRRRPRPCRSTTGWPPPSGSPASSTRPADRARVRRNAHGGADATPAVGGVRTAVACAREGPGVSAPAPGPPRPPRPWPSWRRGG